MWHAFGFVDYCAACDLAGEPNRTSPAFCPLFRRSLARLNSIAGLPKLAEELVNRLVPDADIDPANVGEATFADIDGDGQLELLATLDNYGKSFFY